MKAPDKGDAKVPTLYRGLEFLIRGSLGSSLGCGGPPLKVLLVSRVGSGGPSEVRDLDVGTPLVYTGRRGGPTQMWRSC